MDEKIKEIEGETNMINICDRKGEEGLLIDRFLAFDIEAKSMRNWFNKFGY